MLGMGTAMNLIVAVERNWGIGCGGRLLTTLKEDMAWFRRQTKDKILVYGRETLATYPNGAVLPNRRNIILSRDPAFFVEGAEVCHSIAELAELLADVPSGDVMILGGASVYHQLLPYTRFAYVTQFDKEMKADRYLDNLDELPDWRLVERGQRKYDVLADLGFYFSVYENRQVKQLSKAGEK